MKRRRRHSDNRPAFQARQGHVACGGSAVGSSSFTQSCGGTLVAIHSQQRRQNIQSRTPGSVWEDIGNEREVCVLGG